MMGLVDYGSGSESGSEEDSPQQQAVLKENKKSPVKQVTDGLPSGFFDEETSFGDGNGLSLDLPSASRRLNNRTSTEEHELEGAVKPRDWEQQLAEKNKKKLEKRAKKKEKKEKKHKKDKGEKATEAKKPAIKAKISAFGALGALAAESDSEDEDLPKTEAARPSTSTNKSALLNMLPAPKTKSKPSNIFGQGASGSSLLLPSTLRNKLAAAPVPKIQSAPTVSMAKRKVDSDDSDDDDVSDFFGLTSAPQPKIARVDEERDIPLMACGTGFESFGPTLPTQEEELHPSQMYNYADVDTSMLPQKKAGYISDEQAFNLISRDDTVQVNDRRTLHEITSGIIDVSVDQALGPSVQSNLLKQVTQAAYIRDVNSLPTKSGSVEKTARQKHQITYLAKLAVAREAALEQQWASSKNQKRMARQKYGF